jgi:8-oxo-dGTP diphosphatase
MLYRRMPPNQQHWNGLGGKVKSGETPLACVQREILEEAGIDLKRAQELYFSGIVTWAPGVDPTSSSRGMYAFIADLSPTWPIWVGERSTAEGLLCWKPIKWVCDLKNMAVVGNIPYFLPNMFSQKVPREYYCDYQNDLLVRVVIHPLPPPFMG